MQPPVLGGYDCIWVSDSIIQFENFYFMERPRAVITGVGAYYPDYVLTNEELSRMVDTTDEWIMTRIGIKERRILRDADKGSAYLGARAVEDLFRKTGLKPEEVDN